MDFPKVVITRRIPRQAIELLEQHATVFLWDKEEDAIPQEVLLEEVKDAHAIYTNVSDRIDREVIASAPLLKVISTMAVGFDNIDIKYATERGIAVGHTPGVLSETTADLTFALLMATARRVVEGHDYVKSGKWTSWSPMLMTGQDIYGATIGIIGMGRIGEAVARRATGFGMNILYYNRNPRPEVEEQLGAKYCLMDDLLQESDYVVLLAPGGIGTNKLMGDREFGLMKPHAIFINSSRGTNVDEAALYRALSEGQIWAAGLDVFDVEPTPTDHPLLSLPNVTALPHIGSASIATRTNMAMIAAQNIIAGLLGNELLHIVNPSVYEN
ncbi:D-glycerate dehydrogenase [Ammoniphilus sp. YIM 78166]|uniref:2-hydroxyacid dehydrogenase n=1 Tax=Ammoniphilus sp. YIM 78166 TaxID=1644106 RepID=UPI0010700871|nr:D-glycerate dehydrogenase [Ammoniphilus sp. YIM 78166]